MKYHIAVSQAALALSYYTSVDCSPLLLKRDGDNDISTCGDTWMPREDIDIGQGSDQRRGYNSAVDVFCDDADGETLAEGDTYLSFATEVELNFGKDPTLYGQLGFVYFEIHNRQDTKHSVNSDDCKNYLKKLSEDGGDCSGPDNTDTKGGTWQVINNKLSYHALANTKPPQQDALNKVAYEVISAQEPNTGTGWPLNPWPLSSTQYIKPVSCHSHNDYDHQEIPLFNVLSTGCISVETDVFYTDGDVLIGHEDPKAGRTLRLQYVEPLRAILDHNNGAGVYPANPDAPSFTLLIDFKSTDPETLDAVVAALDPLREQGYLSHVEGDTFVEKQVTVVASGEAPFDRINSGDGVPDRDVFYDAKINALGDQPYSNLNSYYASSRYDDAGDDESRQQLVQAAHDLGLKVRFYELGNEDIWEKLMGWGVDRLNADDLANTARLPRI